MLGSGFRSLVILGALLLAACEPERELETGEQLHDRFWQGVPRDAFGENLDELTVRDVRRVLRLPVGCVASFDRDNGMLFVRAPAEDLQAIDRSISHAEPNWEGPVQLQITGTLLVSPLARPHPWDPPQSVAQILENATTIDRRVLTAFLGITARTQGSEKRPLPPEADGDSEFEEDISRRWAFEARTALADDDGILDVEFTYNVRTPKPDQPDHSYFSEVRSQCLLSLGQPQLFEIGSTEKERLVFALEAVRINPMGLPEPAPETQTEPDPANEG